MSIYRVKTGLNEAEIDLVAVAPQPKCIGIQQTRRTYGGDGTARTVGPFVELEFNFLESVAAYQAVLTQFGINASLSADVTVLVRDGTWNFVRMNGKAMQPDPGKDKTWDRYFPRRIKILIKNLETPV